LFLWTSQFKHCCNIFSFHSPHASSALFASNHDKLHQQGLFCIKMCTCVFCLLLIFHLHSSLSTGSSALCISAVCLLPLQCNWQHSRASHTRTRAHTHKQTHTHTHAKSQPAECYGFNCVQCLFIIEFIMGSGRQITHNSPVNQRRGQVKSLWETKTHTHTHTHTHTFLYSGKQMPWQSSN